MKKILSTLLILIYSIAVIAQNEIVGLWKTIDDNSGKESSVVEIYKKGDLYFGKIVKTFHNSDNDADLICDLCEGDKKDQKIVGMEFLENMKLDGDEFVGGEILDPENGKTYRCKLWIEGDILYVRGYIAFFFRTQKWYRFEN